MCQEPVPCHFLQLRKALHAPCRVHLSPLLTAADRLHGIRRGMLCGLSVRARARRQPQQPVNTTTLMRSLEQQARHQLQQLPRGSNAPKRIEQFGLRLALSHLVVAVQLVAREAVVLWLGRGLGWRRFRAQVTIGCRRAPDSRQHRRHRKRNSGHRPVWVLLILMFQQAPLHSKLGMYRQWVFVVMPHRRLPHLKHCMHDHRRNANRRRFQRLQSRLMALA